jgi:MiaB-like tRNA modifying enzyme
MMILNCGEVMKFYFESYGCTMNKGEAKLMEDILKNEGHGIVDDENLTDAYVLVTCTVIETTELKMMKRIQEFSKTKKPVIISGCMASVQKDQILKQNLDVKFLLPQDFRKIVKIAEALEKQSFLIEREGDLPPTKPHKTADAIIPIASGCLGSCTYCITRIARGKLKSCPPEMVLESIKKKLSEGYKEIRLTSQDNAVYGADINSDLPFLLDGISKLDGDFRVRVGMMNPDNVKPMLSEIIQAYKDPRIYKFLHLPFQSGSKRILENMKRGYSIEDFLFVIDSFRRSFPELTVSTDVIVGFPGETEEDFEKSVALIKELRPNILNITRFSVRPKTEAMDMENKIPSRIAKDRSRILSKIQSEISHEINKTYVGKTVRILVTEHGKSETMMGRTDTYKTVVMEDEVKLCQFVDVEIVDCTEIYLKGKAL